MDAINARAEPTEPQLFTPSQIYTLYDSRARDYRTILIGILALCGAMFIGAVNAMGDGKPAFVPAAFLVVMLVLAALAWLKIRPELKAVHDRAEHIRTRYCTNSKLVPLVDSSLVGRVHRDQLAPQNANVAEPDTPSDSPLT